MKLVWGGKGTLAFLVGMWGWRDMNISHDGLRGLRGLYGTVITLTWKGVGLGYVKRIVQISLLGTI